MALLQIAIFCPAPQSREMVMQHKHTIRVILISGARF
jgi:hypothetical protein